VVSEGRAREQQGTRGEHKNEHESLGIHCDSSRKAGIFQFRAAKWKHMPEVSLCQLHLLNQSLNSAGLAEGDFLARGTHPWSPVAQVDSRGSVRGRGLFCLRLDFIIGLVAMLRINVRKLVLLAAASIGLLGATYAISPRIFAAVPAGDANPPVIRFVKNPEMAPPMQVQDLLGKPVNKDNWAGKVVLVNFWATWCPPCREEIPELLELKKEYKDRLEIVGISEDDDPPESVLKFARQKGMTYPIVMATPELVEAYGGVPALPTSFLIDTQGRVVQKHSGLYPIECARGDFSRYGSGISEKCGQRDRIARRQLQRPDCGSEEARPAPPELRKLLVRLQADAFAVPRERQ
jgi:thiol-disulfide isomerase/thioredoxin